PRSKHEMSGVTSGSSFRLAPKGFTGTGGDDSLFTYSTRTHPVVRPREDGGVEKPLRGFGLRLPARDPVERRAQPREPGTLWVGRLRRGGRELPTEVPAGQGVQPVVQQPLLFRPLELLRRHGGQPAPDLLLELAAAPLQLLP